MNIKSLLALPAALLFAGTAAHAQSTDSAQRVQLTLNKAISIALSDNPTIKIADYEVARVDYSKKTAWGALLPSLSGSVQLNRYIERSTMIMGGLKIESTTDNTASMAMSLSLPLVVPSLWYSIQMSNIDMYLAIEKARSSKITLKNEVSKAYYNIMLSQDSYMTLQESYDIAKQNYDLAKQRYETGMAAEYDYISAEVQLNSTIPTLLQAENGVLQSKFYLKVLLGLPMQTEITIMSSLTDFEDDVQDVQGIAFKDVSAIKNNTDLLQLDFQRQQLAKSLQIQNAQHLPSLTAFGQYGYDGSGSDEASTMNFGGMPLNVPAGMQWYGTGFIVGVKLNVPIFSGMSNVYKAKQIKIQQKQLEEQREYLVNSLGVQARTALDNMDKAAKQISSNKKSVDLARKGYQISQTRYTSGAGTMLELNNSALSLTQAKLQYNQSIVDYLTARADYEKILGTNP